ncbi:flagellar basal body-associated FliL family protein [Desulforegula conservatrix]|uniref:flagellar basal body-associated FliL family protein n=1 Tax=Desulforegula conservatrix TaxID=153026 RepID=UPI00041F3E60|nr:flagellar basal body-associated FliL family protein [Desulforegula conservatrix]
MITTANVIKKMNNGTANPFKTLYCLFSVSILLLFYSCGGPSTQELLIGEWIVKDVDAVVVLNANGTWKLKSDVPYQEHSEKSEGDQVKKDSPKEVSEKKEVPKEGEKDSKEKESESKTGEGKESKEEKKPDEESFGLWDIKDKTLMISADRDIAGLDWKKGDKFDFEIMELTPDLLKLKGKDGSPSEWERIKEEKEGEKTSEAKEDKPLVIEGDPMVINLLQKLQYGKERYLCIKIDYHFKQPPVDPKKEKGKEDEKKEGRAEPYKYQFIHPEIKDAVIMHLGELQYRDVRNYDKIKGLKSGIEKKIAPYFYGELLGVVISDAIITSSKDSIDQFIGQYAPEPAKTEGEKEEKTKKEGGSEEKKSAH